jgi:hypothetical protein
VLYKVALMGLEEPGPVHPAAVEERLGPAAAYWVENDPNEINTIPQIARLALAMQPLEQCRRRLLGGVAGGRIVKTAA